MFPSVFAQTVGGFVWLSLLFVAIGALLLRALVVVLRPRLVRRPELRGLTSLSGCLCVAWVAVLLYGQLGAHYIHACHFPFSRQPGGVRLLVIADPQVTDRFAYPSITSPVLHSVIAFFCDLQLRVSWRAAVWASDPDAAIILGDLIWGASSYSSRSEWDDAVARLNFIFGRPKRSASSLSPLQHDLMRRIPKGSGGFAPGFPTMVICGNHDTWMFNCDAQLNLPRLWKETFGDLNFAVSIGDNVTIVGLATPIMQDRRCGAEHGEMRSQSMEWLEHSYRPAPKGPVILLSHIPTYRDAFFCNARGRARRHGYELHQGRGATWQNFLDSDLSDTIMKRVKPSLILSGDAHDLCEARVQGGIWDVTLPSFSWLEGTYHHGYALLQIDGDGSVETHICWQPQQLFIYVFYACFGAVSICALVLHSIRQGLAVRSSAHRIAASCGRRVALLLCVVAVTFAVTVLV